MIASIAQMCLVSGDSFPFAPPMGTSMAGPPVMRTARAPASAMRSAAETAPSAGVPTSACKHQ